MKKKYIPLTVIFLTVSLIIIAVGLYLSGALPKDLTESVQQMMHIEPQTDDRQAMDQNKEEIPIAADVSFTMPFDMKAVTLNIATDYDSVNAAPFSYKDFISETSLLFDNMRNVRADTVFITPDYTGKYNQLKDDNGNPVDLLRDILKYIAGNDYNAVLVADNDAVYENGQFSADKIKYYLDNYSFNAVLLKHTDSYSDNLFASAAEFFGRFVRGTYAGRISFGVFLPSSAADRYAPQSALGILNAEYLDFAVVEGAAMHQSSLPFTGVIGWWNSVAANYPRVRFYCLHRNDLVCSRQSGWSSATEICDQVRYLWDCECFSGSIFHSAKAIKDNVNSSSVRLSYLLFEGAYKDLAVASVNVDKNSNQITFTGSGPQGHKIICNKKAISTSGVFTYKTELNYGRNYYEFFSCGKTLALNVYNNTELIYSYYPNETLYVLSGTAVTLSAVCVSGASVRCSVGGQEYQMVPSSDPTDDVPAGYQFYSCQAIVNGNYTSDTFIGNAVYSAVSGNRTEQIKGARIIVMPPTTQQTAPGTPNAFYYQDRHSDAVVLNQFSYGDAVSPYKNNGLGTAMLCRILNDDTEQLGDVKEKDTFHADNSTLPADMLDYLKEIVLTEGGNLRYVMQSGITVYAKDCELICNGFVMPANRVVVDHVEDAAADKTDIIFSMDWFSPITLKCLPQAYKRGYGSYSYNVSEFNAQYVDVKFHYTQEFFNSSSLSFGPSSVFSHAELYKEGESNLILRLYLKKPGQFYGFDMYRNDQKQLVISFKKRQDGALTGKTIMLDPGHGGLAMTGTAVADNSVAEKTVTLSVAYKLKALLEQKGATVIMTRYSDTSYSLEERAEILCRYNPDIFVSIHCDGTDNEADAGTHSFYFRPYSQPLANEINASLANVYKTKVYAPDNPNYSKVDKTIKFYPFYVTRMDNCPAVLVETGFLTNKIEGQLMIQDNTQAWIASGIFNGIEAYFANNH